MYFKLRDLKGRPPLRGGSATNITNFTSILVMNVNCSLSGCCYHILTFDKMNNLYVKRWPE